METEEENIPTTLYKLDLEKITTIEDLKVFIEFFYNTLCLPTQVELRSFPIGKYYTRVEDMSLQGMQEEVSPKEG